MSGRARALFEARREELNARFFRDGRGTSPERMLAFLARTVTPIVDAWPTTRAEDLGIALFELGLVGASSGLVGESGPTAFEQALLAGLAKMAPLVDHDPRRVLRLLGNGYLNIVKEMSAGLETREGEAPAEVWLRELMAAGATGVDHEVLAHLGLALAWWAGLAHAREAALDALTHLPPALQARYFGGEGKPDTTPERRFLAPLSVGGTTRKLGELRFFYVVGGFVGFGGPFLRPPLARVVEGHLVVTDGVATFEVFADLYGARLSPAPWAHAAAGSSSDTGGAALEPGRVVSVGRASCAIGALPEARSAAHAQGMLAVTAADSHKVFILGRGGAA